MPVKSISRALKGRPLVSRTRAAETTPVPVERRTLPMLRPTILFMLVITTIGPAVTAWDFDQFAGTTAFSKVPEDSGPVDLDTVAERVGVRSCLLKARMFDLPEELLRLQAALDAAPQPERQQRQAAVTQRIAEVRKLLDEARAEGMRAFLEKRPARFSGK